MEVTIGGQRIGSGSKMKAELPNYEMSSNRMQRVRRTTISAGTLIPVFKMITQAGDRIKMRIRAQVITNATIGALYGSYKFQVDVFSGDMRLYIADLHNNTLGIGLDMTKAKFPLMTVSCPRNLTAEEATTMTQIHPSSIMAHLGVMGIGRSTTGAAGIMRRKFNGIPYLMYCDIFKNYYANKQETDAYYIHTAVPVVNTNITNAYWYDGTGDTLVPQWPTTASITLNPMTGTLRLNVPGGVQPINEVYIRVDNDWWQLGTIFNSVAMGSTAIYCTNVKPEWWGYKLQAWGYASAEITAPTAPVLKAFPLENIDIMRTRIFQWAGQATALTIQHDFVGSGGTIEPYSTILAQNTTNYLTSLQYSQEGLFVKTYQSDRYNNWLKAATVDAINTQSQISTAGNAFSISSLILGTKLYEMQNAIMTSGGSYDDWQESQFNHKAYGKPEIPIYHGGLTRELEFDEVVSNSAAETAGGIQALGSIAGKGRFTKETGGEVEINVQEAGYIMAIASMTPRIDYSQGNDFDMRFTTMNNIHKPALDQIGYQDSPTDEITYWDTAIDGLNVETFYSLGKVPAWLDWKTAVNQNKGNFALINNKMYMVLDRRYKMNTTTGRLQDGTTYIDPSKFNYTFAQTTLDAQNFDLQVAFDVDVRRKISNRVMPKL